MAVAQCVNKFYLHSNLNNINLIGRPRSIFGQIWSFLVFFLFLTSILTCRLLKPIRSQRFRVRYESYEVEVHGGQTLFRFKGNGRVPNGTGIGCCVGDEPGSRTWRYSSTMTRWRHANDQVPLKTVFWWHTTVYCRHLLTGGLAIRVLGVKKWETHEITKSAAEGDVAGILWRNGNCHRP